MPQSYHFKPLEFRGLILQYQQKFLETGPIRTIRPYICDLREILVKKHITFDTAMLLVYMLCHGKVTTPTTKIPLKTL